MSDHDAGDGDSSEVESVTSGSNYVPSGMSSSNDSNSDSDDNDNCNLKDAGCFELKSKRKKYFSPSSESEADSEIKKFKLNKLKNLPATTKTLDKSMFDLTKKRKRYTSSSSIESETDSKMKMKKFKKLPERRKTQSANLSKRLKAAKTKYLVNKKDPAQDKEVVAAENSESSDSISEIDMTRDFILRNSSDTDFPSKNEAKNISNHSIDLSDSESSSAVETDSLKQNEAPNKNRKTTKKEPKSKASQVSSKANESVVSSEMSSFDISASNINLDSVGPVLKNKNNEIAINSEEGCKRNCCYYCLKIKIATKNKNKKVLFTKLVEHYETAHSKERLIEKLDKIPKEKLIKNEKPSRNYLRRKKILDALRRKANNLNNKIAETADQFVLKRRPQKQFHRNIAHYKPCFNCTERFSITSLHKHVAKCTSRKSKKKRYIRSKARETDGDYHQIATEDSIKIIAKMRDTEAIDAIRFDETIFVWLNAEASKHEVINQKHNHKSIKASISRLGNLLLLMKKNNPAIEQFSDIFHEDYYEEFIAAVKTMGKPEPVTKYLQAPATANDMYNLMITVASIYDVTMCGNNDEKRKEVQAFDKKLRTMWHFSLGNTIAETQALYRRKNAKKLPSKADIVCLNNYLEVKMKEAYENLKDEYSDHGYEALRDAIVVFLELTNCRRPGETERMAKVDYNNNEIEGNDCRIQVRGKRTKPVPIVFDKKVLDYLKLLVLHRESAKISEENPFIFATIDDVPAADFSTVSACKLMKKFADECGAEKPSTLRATSIRQQLATEQLDKGITDHGVEKLAGFMGHTPKIHRQNYRKSQFHQDIQTAKLVGESQGRFQETGASKEVKKSTVPIIEEEIDTSNIVPLNIEKLDAKQNNHHEEVPDSNQISSNKSTDSCLPKIASKRTQDGKENNLQMLNVSDMKQKKTAWLKEQIDVLLNRFPNALDPAYKVPSADEIQLFIDTTDDPILKNRKQPQIRTWIHLQRKSAMKDSAVPQRNHIPSFIYSSFDQYIAAKKLPSHHTCAKFIAQSSSHSSTTVQNIKDWVSLAIKRKSK